MIDKQLVFQINQREPAEESAALIFHVWLIYSSITAF